jgi:hypothetical protein
VATVQGLIGTVAYYSRLYRLGSGSIVPVRVVPATKTPVVLLLLMKFFVIAKRLFESL